MKYFFGAIVLYLVHDLVNCQEASKVKLDVFYETLCPDSIQFIKSQLYPTFLSIGEIMDINLFPYGKAKVSYCYTNTLFVIKYIKLKLTSFK